MKTLVRKLTLKGLFYFTIKKLSNKQHKLRLEKYYYKSIEKFNFCDNKKSEKLIKREMRILEKYWGTFPFQYYRYNMYRKDCRLTIDEMKDFVPDYFAYYLFFPLSFKDRNVLCEDKILTSVIAKGLNIPQPKMLFSTSNSRIYSSDLEFIDEVSALEIISESEVASLFFKPTWGVGGIGIHVFDRNDTGQYVDKDDVILDSDFLNTIKNEDYIVQEGLNQHETLNAIYPSAVNTFRIVTECQDDEVKIPFALFRMGCGGNRIDNASSGGVYCKVDIKTGILSKEAYSVDGAIITRHPDTDFLFENYKLPMWGELTEFAKRVAIKFNHTRYLGWDIAYTENGPVIVEVNNGPGVSILQDHYGGIRKQLGITNPREYWFCENYALKNL